MELSSIILVVAIAIFLILILVIILVRKNKEEIYNQREKNPESDQAMGKGIAIGLPIGMGTGIALGVAMDNIAMGVAIGSSIGVSIGVALGASFKKQAEEKQGLHQNVSPANFPKSKVLLLVGIFTVLIGLLVAGLVFFNATK